VSAGPGETYTPGHGAPSVSFMARRRAATHAAFFIPLLRPGMRLIDCGCGPGVISLDLARLVRPGGVLGIDRNAEQTAASRDAAAQEGLDLRFEAGSAYELPAADDSCDAVFAHALIEHLAEPERAAAEFRRVLKPGGFVGLRSPDWGGFLLNPYPPDVAAAIARYQALMRGNGGDAHAGRKLGPLLRRAGFARVAPGASYEIYEDPALIAEYLALQLAPQDAAGAAALRRWARDRDALFAQAWGEAIGFKP
jgi:SAM-dependent methyltransferase